MKTFIGLDFGSDSVRAVLVSANGEFLGSCVHNYARWAEKRYCDAARGMFRQHPLDYLEGMETVICGVLSGQDRNAVRGIAIDTTGATPCAVNSAGVPLALLGLPFHPPSPPAKILGQLCTLSQQISRSCLCQLL